MAWCKIVFDNMKMCVVGLRGFPNVMGGVETHCEQIYPRIARLLPDTEIVVLARSPYVGETPYIVDGVQVKPLWTTRSVYFETILHGLIAVIHARLVQRCTLLHMHALGTALLAPLARLLGMRVVATHHGRDYERRKWGWLSRRVLRLGERVMVLTAEQILCVDAADARRLSASYPDRAHRIHAIPNGAAIAEPDGERNTMAELGLEPGRYVLAVGRLVPEKGFHDLIAAFKLISGGDKLVIVGGDDHGGVYSRDLLREASDRVIFTGVRRRGEISTLLRNAGLFVLPSAHEGHPLAALEALAAGAPVLLSDIAPNREIGLAAAHYYPQGDVAALADILRRPNHNALRNEDPAVLRRYDWDDIAQRTARILAIAGEAGGAGVRISA